MNIENGIVPSAELQEAATIAENCQAKYDDLQDRLVRQRQKVNKLSLELRELVMAKKWEEADIPEVAALARQECSLAAECFQDEQDLLLAIETAARNSRTDVSIAGNRVFRIISQLVSAQFSGAVIEGTADQVSAA